jgi:hypothetical protein
MVGCRQGLKIWSNLLKFDGFGGGQFSKKQHCPKKTGTIQTPISTVYPKFDKNNGFGHV